MKKIIIFVLTILALACLCAISVSAAEPDTTKETVTLSDGTVCPIWDTDGNGLIWYITATDDAGVNTYAYVSATDPSVDYYNGWNGGNQMNSVKITANGTTYDAKSMVVVNISKDVKITSGQRVGNYIDYFAQKAFYDCKKLEYVYLPAISTNLSSEMFKSCSNLKYINFEDLTAITTVANQALNGCSSLFAGEVLDLTNVPIKSLGSHGFTGMKITKVILPSTLESINTTNAFDSCEKLEAIIGLKPLIENGKITSIGAYTFNKCKVLKNIDGLMENGILVIPEGITSINSLAFTECDQIRFVDFPSTIDFVGQACFSYCDNLVLVSFDKVDAKIRAAIANGEDYKKVTFNNCGTFKGCPKLVAMSVPEGTTDLINRFVAQGCTSLTAFYMPNSITSMGTNGGGQGPFCSATNMYFVNEPFTVSQCLVNGEIDLTKLSLPAKPSVYFMPTSLTTTHGHVQTNQWSKDGTFFRNCTSINDVIVFGENYVDFNARNAFQGMGTKASPKTVVFLGDITQSVTFKNAQYISFVFANKADKSPEDLNIIDMHYDQNNTDSYMYFCYDSSRYNYRISQNDMANYADIAAKVAAVMATKTNDTLHIEATVSLTEAECENVGYIKTICFCGAEVSSEEIPELGHNFENGEKSYTFGGIFDDVTSCVACTRNCGASSEAVNEGAVLDEKGYSYSEINGYKSFTRGYQINLTLLDIYEAQKGVSIEIGFAFARADIIPDDGVTLSNFQIVKAIKEENETITYKEINYMIRYRTDEYLNSQVVVTGYVREGDNVIFGNDSFESVSYNSVVALCDSRSE